ncbi:MAG: hypothetical protein V3S24_22520 [Candidatus Tectomicrobia bacterium]
METPYAKSPTTITAVGDKARGRSAGLPPHRGLGPQRGLVVDVRAAAVYFTSLRLEIPCEMVLPLLSPTGRHETLAPGNPCDATFPLSYVTCPGHALPRCTLLRATAARLPRHAGAAAIAAGKGPPAAGDAGTPQGSFRGLRS